MSTKAKTPAPQWREFEMLVARIEQVLAGDTIKVKSPDRIRCRTTGRLREVDASIRTKVGSSEVLVTVECRKRRATQNVTWIEQLATKKEAIGASRTIAVAFKSFSEEAMVIAESHGIDLRVLSDITDAEMQAWALPLPSSVVHVYKQCEFFDQPNIVFYPEVGDQFGDNALDETASADANGVNSLALVRADGTKLTLNDFWLEIDAKSNIFENVPSDNQAHLFRLSVAPPDDVHVLTRLGPRKIRSVELPVALRWKHEEMPLSAASVVKYVPASASDPMPTYVRAEFATREAATTNIRLSIQVKTGGGLAALSVEPLPGREV